MKGKRQNRKGRNRPMEAEARKLAKILGDSLPPNIGFTLFLYEYGDEGWLTYVSSGRREDMIKTINEWLDLQQRTPGGIGTSSN